MERCVGLVVIDTFRYGRVKFANVSTQELELEPTVTCSGGGCRRPHNCQHPTCGCGAP